MVGKVICSLGVLTLGSAQGFVMTLNATDFGITTTFSSVTNFSFTIEVDGPLQTGIYNNPTINLVEYQISGSLAAGTPSGFPSFGLVRSMTGAEFYAQGSSLNFTIAASANLSDGLQVSELSGADPVFVFNGREEDTGRYHPSLFELNGDGTGRVQNSNNSGPTVTNPATGNLVDVDFGEEYISDLSFDAATTTIAVPEPTTGLLPLLGVLGILFSRKRATN